MHNFIFNEVLLLTFCQERTNVGDYGIFWDTKHYRGTLIMMWNTALIMMWNMALITKVQNLEEHDHDALEISFGVPGMNVTFESKEVVEVTW